MHKAENNAEKAPLLQNRNALHSLSISSADEIYKERDATGRISVKYEPKVTMFSPYKLAVVLCVLLVEMCERMAYYGTTANLILFCTSVLNYTSNDATTISLVFSGTVYILPIVGGYIADSWSNRFNVIYAAGLIYLCGLFLLVCCAVDFQVLFGDPKYGFDVSDRRIFYILGLVFIAFGTGGIKANVGNFGAQQVEDLGPEAVQTFFNWFYWFVNAGGLVAFTGIAYVQQNVSFSWGFVIPFICMILSLIFLHIARTHYILKTGEGSVLGTTFKICGQACCRESPHINGKRKVFDSARREYGGDFDSGTVDGVITVLGMLPVFFFIIMFWAIYSQMQTTYFLQGERMDLTAGSGQVPVAVLNAFNTVAVVIFIPILDRALYPFLKWCGRPLTHLQRIGIGFILSACSVFIAGWIEIERKKKLGFYQVVGEEQFFAANLTVFIQVPQFVLIGTGEAFTSIAGYEFAYTQAPKNLQGLVMGIFVATNGLGSYVSTAIISIIEAATKDYPWFPDDINDGKAEYIFFVFGGLMILFFLGYLPLSIWYKYRVFLTDKEAKIKVDTTDGYDKYKRHFDSDSMTVL
ncbi:hypothetical protein BsWGS_05999 [Bradybaena similaris]